MKLETITEILGYMSLSVYQRWIFTERYFTQHQRRQC